MALARLLWAEGAQVTVSDARPAEALRDEVTALQRSTVSNQPGAAGVPLRFSLGGNRPEDALARDVVFVSPGVPWSNPVVDAAREARIRLSSLTELFFARCRAPIIGVTGSSGKTTTTTLIGEILRRGGDDGLDGPVYVGGNIGTPLIEEVAAIPSEAHVVLELSSFQLEHLTVSPHIAVVTNLSPNHLDRHGSMEAYVEAKSHILRHQTAADWAILNADDPLTPYLSTLCPGQVLSFSLHGAGPFQRVSDGRGAYYDGERLLLALDGVPRPLCGAGELRVPGRHNVANALAAALVGAREQVAASTIAAALRAFRGVPHRLELVGVVDGVRWYNDSIATAPERTLAALDVFAGTPIVLIAGGRDKHLPWQELAARIVRDCRALVLVGEATGLIADHVVAAWRAGQAAGTACSLEGESKIIRCTSLEQAVERAAARARRGDVALLSPGCASYDMFKDFEERGTRFRRLVEGLHVHGNTQ
jgi:UDP-N-acetylmuramoylalanine--D-glutamate ligase